MKNRNTKKGKDDGKKSYMLIEFAAPGSAEIKVQLESITPNQMFVAAHFLNTMAERQINDRWTHEAMVQAQRAQEMGQVQDLIRGARPL